MLSDEVTAALGPFFDQIGPSHDELTTLFRRSGLERYDPQQTAEGPVGKMKRVRGVLYAASDTCPQQGARLVRALVDIVRANGGFRPETANYPGEGSVVALRSAFRNLGYDLDPGGHMRPKLLETLEGPELSEALRAYVRRIRLGADDPSLVVGSAKSLEEAAARHVLKEVSGSYPGHSDMVTTLYQAFAALGLSAPGRSVIEALPTDPRAALQHALLLLGCAVNRFRNAFGEGHGRPEPPAVTQSEAATVSQAAALVTQLLLDHLALK